jgi:Domain of unknown function (DUF5671)
MENNNKPRDFFLHIATFVSLYFTAIALITLLFTLIDYHFPNALAGQYNDPYSGPVLFAIASLIILAPLFVFFMRMLQEEMRVNPARATLSVRRWLTYITLFIAGSAVVGELINLVYSFLSGDLLAPSFIKILTLLAIAGAGFGYFFLDLKSFWQTHKAESQYAGLGFVTLVAGSILLGFYVMGSPSVQRDLRLDEERRQNLETIQMQLVSYWQGNTKLPDTIDALNNPLQGFSVPTDPEMGAAYEYKKKDDHSFEVCATFAQPLARNQGGEYYPVMPGLSDASNWQHDAGHSCFVRTIDPTLIKPTQPDFSTLKPVDGQPTILPAKAVKIN